MSERTFTYRQVMAIAAERVKALRAQNARLNVEASLKTEYQRELIALRTMFNNLQEQHDTKARELQDEKTTLYIYRVAFWSLVVVFLLYVVVKNG